MTPIPLILLTSVLLAGTGCGFEAQTGSTDDVNFARDARTDTGTPIDAADRLGADATTQGSYVDRDGDERGEGPGCLGSDCDDDNANRYSGATEVCDGVDNDCVGATRRRWSQAQRPGPDSRYATSVRATSPPGSPWSRYRQRWSKTYASGSASAFRQKLPSGCAPVVLAAGHVRRPAVLPSTSARQLEPDPVVSLTLT